MSHLSDVDRAKMIHESEVSLRNRHFLLYLLTLWRARSAVYLCDMKTHLLYLAKLSLRTLHGYRLYWLGSLCLGRVYTTTISRLIVLVSIPSSSTLSGVERHRLTVPFPMCVCLSTLL